MGSASIDLNSRGFLESKRRFFSESVQVPHLILDRNGYDT